MINILPDACAKPTVDNVWDWFTAPLEDPDHVEARHAAVGLQPLSAYVAQWNIKWDVEEFKRQLPALEASLAQPTR